MRHLHGQSLRTAEKQPIEGYSREFAAAVRCKKQRGAEV
jgi:hypothetical protein